MQKTESYCNDQKVIAPSEESFKATGIAMIMSVHLNRFLMTVFWTSLPNNSKSCLLQVEACSHPTHNSAI